MNKQEKLSQLKQRNEELEPIVFKSFKSDEDLDAYEKANQKFFDEYYDNKEAIEGLVWELKTPEEKKEYTEQMRLLKLKAEGKFNMDSFK